MSLEPQVERSPVAVPVAATTPDIAAPATVATTAAATHETEDSAAEQTLPLNAASILPRLRKKAYKFSCACGFAILSSVCMSFAQEWIDRVLLMCLLLFLW